jgi:hypothetical protein
VLFAGRRGGVSIKIGATDREFIIIIIICFVFSRTGTTGLYLSRHVAHIKDCVHG